MKGKRIAVIGSGISGLTIANLLKENNEVTIFEKEDEIGGLIKCKRIQDCLFHRVGGHVFNSNNEEVLRWFWSRFDKEREFVKAGRNAKIYLENQIIGYPIENNLYNLDESKVICIISELLSILGKSKIKYNANITFGDFLKNNFGSTLYNLYFKPYNEKIWQTNLNEISLDWLEGKLPMPDVRQIIESNILRREESKMLHSTFFYPKEGGSQFIINRLSENLDIRTGIYINEIRIVKGKIYIGNDDMYDNIIYTGDIRILPGSLKDLLKQNSINVSYLEELRSNGTSNLFCETDESDISWLYLPESFTKAHRIIYTGNFSDSNSRGSIRKTCVVEFSGNVDFNLMCKEVTMLPGNLKPLGYNYEPNSYVIQDRQTRSVVNAAKAVLQLNGIYLLGRFAEWEYYNMDNAIEAALKLNDAM